MSNLQTDTIQVPDPLVDQKKINSEKSEPSLDQLMNLITQIPYSTILNETQLLDNTGFTTTWVKHANVEVPANILSGAQLWSFNVTWQNVKRYINVNTLFDKNHNYVHLVFMIKFLQKGNPMYWGKTVLTFNPDPNFEFDSDDTINTLIVSGYQALNHINWFSHHIFPLWRDDTATMIIPFIVPMRALRNLVGPTVTNNDNAYRNLKMGTVDLRTFTSVRTNESIPIQPVYNIHFSALVAYGSSEYTSLYNAVASPDMPDPTDRTLHTIADKGIFVTP